MRAADTHSRGCRARDGRGCQLSAESPPTEKGEGGSLDTAIPCASSAFSRRSVAMAGLVRMDSGRLLDELLGGGASFPSIRGGGGGSLRPMLVDVAERPDCYEMLVRAPRALARLGLASSHADAFLSSQVDLPGIPKEHMALEVEGQTIKLSTTQTAEEAAKESGDSGSDVTWHRIERSTVYASRALRFPEEADMHAIVAHADDGVLHVRIAKKADAKRDISVVKVT